MEILTSVEQLKHDTFDGGGRDGMPRWLGVVMDDLQEVMLGVFEDHKDAFVFQDDLDKANDIHVT